MNRGSRRIAEWAQTKRGGFNEAPIHESGKFAIGATPAAPG